MGGRRFSVATKIVCKRRKKEEEDGMLFDRTQINFGMEMMAGQGAGLVAKFRTWGATSRHACCRKCWACSTCEH